MAFIRLRANVHLNEDGTFTIQLITGQSLPPPNTPPVAVDDSVSGGYNTNLVIPASTLLGNNSALDGGTLSIQSVSNFANGTASITGGGTTVTFVPTNGFWGMAGFDYVLADGQGGIDTGSVTIDIVNPSLAAIDNTVSTVQNTPVVIVTADLLLNDTGANSGTLTVTGVSNPTNGIVSLVSDTITFTPTAGFIGTAGFDYAISDGQGGTDTEHMTVTVNNAPPVAVDDTVNGIFNTPLVLNISSLVSNDTDLGGDSLTITSVSNFANGTAAITGGGTTVTFTPTNGYCGNVAGFDYTVSDCNGGTDIGHVTVTIPNPPPVAIDDSVNAVQDTPLVLAATDLMTNDTDANTGTLVITAVSNPTNGSVALSGGNTVVTFTPGSGFTGTAGFDYTVSDGQGRTDVGHVTVTVGAALTERIFLATNGEMQMLNPTTGAVTDAFDVTNNAVAASGALLLTI